MVEILLHIKENLVLLFLTRRGMGFLFVITAKSDYLVYFFYNILENVETVRKKAKMAG